jgi:hypothetical protein
MTATTVSPSPASFESLTSSPKMLRRSARAKRERCGVEHDLLGRYADIDGHAREIVALPGASGSVLVVDRDSSTLGDGRLVAHIASDEPPENAAVACSSYLQDRRGRWSRRVTPEDLELVPFTEEPLLRDPAEALSGEVELIDRRGREHRLEIFAGERCSREVRWCRRSPEAERAGGVLVSVREVVAAMESYEPVRILTAQTIACYRARRRVSVTTLGLELERIDASPLVLNRGLRERALQVLERDGLSMSEIAMRCGRVKHDSRGNESGETSWLARRLGIVPSAGESAPTPWVHSDVLALIARDGLRISPREVELG